MRLESTRPASISNSFSSNQQEDGISIFQFPLIIFFRRLESTPPPPTARTPGLHRFGLVKMCDIWHMFNPYIQGGIFDWSALKMTKCQITCKSLKKVIMIFSRSGFDVSRASWEFPEGTCAGYNGEQRMMFLIMMTKTRMLMMFMTMTVMMTMMILIHNSKKLLLTPWDQRPMGSPAQFYF